MATQTTLLICFILSLSHAASPQFHGVARASEEQILQLIDLIQNEIVTTLNDLHLLDANFQEYSVIVKDNGYQEILGHFLTINDQVASVTDYATSNGYNVTSCVEKYYYVLQELPILSRQALAKCVDNVHVEKNTLLRDAKYLIDVIINKVYHTERQLLNCGEDATCILAVLEQVELHKVNLVQDIKKEAGTATDELTALKVLVDSCKETHVFEYITEGYGILTDLIACVNTICCL